MFLSVHVRAFLELWLKEMGAARNNFFFMLASFICPFIGHIFYVLCYNLQTALNMYPTPISPSDQNKKSYIPFAKINYPLFFRFYLRCKNSRVQKYCYLQMQTIKNGIHLNRYTLQYRRFFVQTYQAIPPKSRLEFRNIQCENKVSILDIPWKKQKQWNRSCQKQEGTQLFKNVATL